MGHHMTCLSNRVSRACDKTVVKPQQELYVVWKKNLSMSNCLNVITAVRMNVNLSKRN